MNKIRPFLVLIPILIILKAIFLEAYDDKETHPKIVEKAIINSEIAKDSIINALGMQDGFDTYISGQRIQKWLQDGSAAEDTYKCRASNHFHNPLLPWHESFMSDDCDYWLSCDAARVYCEMKGWIYADRKSNVTWATGYLSPAPSGNKDIFSTDENYAPYNWDKAREYYHMALMAVSEEDMQANLSKALETLGHVLHLLQDVSVPAHVRNDFVSHVSFNLPSLFGTNWIIQSFENYVKEHTEIIESSTAEYPIFTGPSLTDFWDTDIYTLSDISPPTGPLGLAEITNAYYFSDSTIRNNNPSDLHWFNFPQVYNTNCRICEEDKDISFAGYKETVKRKYISRKDKLTNDICPPSADRATDHFAVISANALQDAITDDNIHLLPLHLDDEVHNTYANELIPRAVGYSAALLDYFFRGQLDVTCLPVFYYNNLFVLRLKIRNMTASQEAMSDGTFTVVCQYNDGNSKQFVRASDIPSGTITYDNEVEIDFFLPWNSADEIITREEYESGVTCSLAFRGTLGNESGAVIGKVFSLGEEIRFNEEWDNGLTGNYPWIHTTAEDNPPNGTTTNVIENGVLIKENIRNAGFATPRTNQSFLYIPGEGVPISPHSTLQFKIDDLSINTTPPEGHHWQIMMLYFNYGDLNLQFSIDNQWADLGWPDVNYRLFTPGAIMLGNIHEMFNEAKIPIPDPLYLNRIGFGQHLYELEDPSVSQHAQSMKVDFIRIIDAKPAQ